MVILGRLRPPQFSLGLPCKVQVPNLQVPDPFLEKILLCRGAWNWVWLSGSILRPAKP